MFEIPAFYGASMDKLACPALGLASSIYIFFHLPLGYDLPVQDDSKVRELHWILMPLNFSVQELVTFNFFHTLIFH